MKLIYTTLLALLLTPFLHSQEIGIGVNYQQLNSKQFNELINTYNFSRPFLEKKQPFLKSGFGAQFSYQFKPKASEKSYTFSSGILLGLSQFGSELNTTFSTINFTLRTAELGYTIEWTKAETPMFINLGISGMVGQLNKKVDDEIVTVDDENLSSLQWGAVADLKVGYRLPLSYKFVLSPYFGIGYAPYFSEGKSETVINQTTSVIKESYTNFIRWSLGVNIKILNNNLK